MRKYFYVKESTRFGPVSFEELKKNNITTHTLIWFEGLTEWKTAGEVPEIADLLVKQDADYASLTEVSKEQDIIVPAIERERSESLPAIAEKLNDTTIQNSEYVDSSEIVDSSPAFDATNTTVIKPGMFASPFSFNGRIRRTEFWITYIIVNILFVIASEMVVNAASDGSFAVLFVIYIPALWLFMAQNAKRCHDRGNSGWFQIIPFYGLWMAFAGGDPFPNEYGPSPKG